MAGTFQVAVIVLPRPGFMRLVPTSVDCKYAPLYRHTNQGVDTLLQVYSSRAILSCFLFFTTDSQDSMASLGRGRLNTYGDDRGWEASVGLTLLCPSKPL